MSSKGLVANSWKSGENHSMISFCWAGLNWVW